MTAKDSKSYNLAVTDGPSDGQYELGAADLVLDILSTHDARQVSVAALCRAGELVARAIFLSPLRGCSRL